jgi:hypothetical protein
MRNRSIALVRVIFLLALSALLGFLILFEAQKVSADLNAGHVTNIASAFVGRTISPIDAKTAGAIQAAALTIAKSVTETSYAQVGDVLHYSYLVTNSGTTILPGPVTISDDKATDEDCPNVNTVGNNDGNLDPAEFITCTASYTISQADLNIGSVTNVASASADLTTSPTATKTVNASQTPALTLVKSASTTPTNYDHVGQVISYSYLVTNSGNVSRLGPVTVSDDKAANELCPAVTTVGNFDNYLDPLESITCTASYTITQADLNAGSVTNVASASAGGTTSPTATKTVNASQTPALTLVKSASTTPANYDHIGQVISYSYLVTNSGNVRRLGPVTVSDDKAANELCPAVTTVGNLDSYLDPLESITCTASYTITQTDLNAGSVTNVASASAGGTTSPTATKTVNASQSQHLSLTKVATEASFSAAGVTLHYTLAATNDGNVTLTNVIITDVKLGALTCSQPATLAPLATLTCTDTYLTTLADMNFGRVDNTANASGMNGAITVNALPATESVPAIQTPALTITKTATPTAYDYVGQVIGYSFKVENTGNVTLTAPFTVFDDKTTDETCPLTPTFLDPGQFITCTASYTILRRDMNSGSVTNTAHATGKFGSTTVTSNTGSVTIRARQTLAFAFLPYVNVLRPGVQVLPVSFEYVSHGSMFIVGEVVNNTADSLTSVEVAVNFFKAGGLLVGTDHAYMWPIDLPAWEKGCFKITMDTLPDWSYYQFETPTYKLRATSSGLTIINHSGLYNTANGAYDITGQVRNAGNQHSISVGVSGTLYNGTGVPVGCEHLVISPDLAPGQTSSFALNFSSYYRSYNDVTNYRLRVAGDLP